MKAAGCLGRMVVLIVLVVAGLVAIVIHESGKNDVGSAPRVAIQAPPAAPSVNPSAPAETVDPAPPVVKSSGQAVPSMQTVADATDSLKSAREASLARFHATPAYKTLIAEVDSDLSALEELRKGPASQDRLDASAKYNKARLALSQMEITAIAADPAVRKAGLDLADADSRMRRSREERWQKERATAQRVAEEKANDPIQRAINDHMVIRGMTYQQVVESLGKPYSITQGADVIDATWKWGTLYWTVVFYSNEASIISRTQL
ncbi:MAG TPA: hypothetical protein VFC78_07835 [Tepidisphaeraceae bacterium]|nr:hypothetical protein [Tepidisphaeraceae bacterium]